MEKTIIFIIAPKATQTLVYQQALNDQQVAEIESWARKEYILDSFYRKFIIATRNFFRRHTSQ